MSFLRKSRILCVALIIALIATIIAPIGSFTAFAGYVDTYGDFTYGYSNDEITILEYNGSGGDVVIPSTIDGDPVVAIGESAFFDCDTLVGVVMPESVTMVGTEAFCDCTSLESVDMPGVTVIESYAFGDCYSLSEVNMPRIEIINENSFSYCESLTDILVADDNEYFSTQDGVLLNKSNTVLVLYPSGKSETSYTAPDSVLEIGKKAFFGNKTLTTVNLPNVITLGTSAFDSCYYIETITMPNVETVGYEAFDYCHTLKAVDIPKANLIDTYAFYQCNSLEYVNIPKVTTIGYWAFYGCTALESIAMPNVVEIGEEAFQDCESLVMVDIPRVKGIETDAFSGCHEDLTIYAPSGTYAQTYAENNSINFVATNSAYGDFTYYRTGGEIIITFYTGEGGSVTIPEEIESYPVTTIGDSAFMCCDGLIHITMPSVTTIEDYAFAECVNLLSATMPEVITLGEHAFDSCENLETATMPKVVTIGFEAFDYCHALKEADIPNATTIDTYAFYECIALESVNMPKVTEIGVSSFYCCSSLTSVDMPELRMLGEYAFEYCTALESVSMPKATIIGEYAFEDCSALKDVVMPAAEQIYFGVFDGCPSTLTIWGYADTFTQSYALENGYNFGLMKVHTVTFYFGGPIDSQKVDDGEFAIEPYPPTLEGKSFIGWFTNGGEYYYFDTPVTEDINLYARFGYAVALCLNGYPVGWQVIEEGECAIEPDPPAQEGKIFLGWYTEDDVKYDFSTPITGEIYLYAKFVDDTGAWFKSVSSSVIDGKIYFTVITEPGAYNRVKLTYADDRGGYIAYTNNYTVNSDGDYVWTIKATAPLTTTDYSFDVRSSETGKYLKDYVDLSYEVIAGVKSVSHEIVGDKLVFTVITGASDYNRVKVSFADDLKGYIAYTNNHTVNSDGDYVWTIKVDIPTSATEYAFDIRSATTGKYIKDYFNYSVDAVVTPDIKSVSHVIANDKIVFTVVTKAGNFSRIKVTTSDNLGGSLAVASTYTVNSDGDYVWTVKADAPSVVTDYAFDLRNAETSKYQKEYYNYSVDYIPVVKSISHEFSSGKIIFTLITTPGNYSRIKATTSDNLGGSLGVSVTYVVNENGDYVWTLKIAEPTATTNYAFDLRSADTNKYLKDYYYYEVEPKEPTIISATHEIVGDKVVFSVVTAPGAYNRVKVAYADNKTGYIAYSNSYTVNSDGNYVWTIKVAAPTAETEYVFDARATATSKYIRDYFYYSV